MIELRGQSRYNLLLESKASCRVDDIFDVWAGPAKCPNPKFMTLPKTVWHPDQTVVPHIKPLALAV